MINEVFILLNVSILLFFVYFFYISLKETEYLAARRAIFIVIFISAPLLFFAFGDYLYKNEIELVLISFVLISAIIFLVPVNIKNPSKSKSPRFKIDERDIMFSRNELETGSENYDSYYSANPDKLELDNSFRSEPGLLNKDSFYFKIFPATSAHSTFELVDSLSKNISGQVADDKTVLDTNAVSEYIKNWTKKLGAVDVGITETKDYHFYSTAGRNLNYGKDIKNNHKFAMAFTVEMDYDMVKGGPAFPIVMESAQQYLNAGQIAIQVASFIRNLGYDARAHIDANYQVVCPLVARDAGLGEIGRMGLLMTPKLGPRVRIGVVTTELKLKTDGNNFNSSVIDFCNLCKKCAECCPSNAIQKDNRSELNGTLRWKINSEACFTFWCKAGSDCGRCVAVCPYSHPDNFLHNLIRWGIRRNWLFRRFALVMDDFFYGKKPKPNRLPEWIK